MIISGPWVSSQCLYVWRWRHLQFSVFKDSEPLHKKSNWRQWNKKDDVYTKSGARKSCCNRHVNLCKPWWCLWIHLPFISFRKYQKRHMSCGLRVVSFIKQEVNYLRAIFGYPSYIVHFPATLHVWNGLHVPYCTYFWTCWPVPCSTGLIMTMIHQTW